MLKSKTLSVIAFVAVIAMIVLTFPYRTAWWAFIDVFCLFMAAFLHLMSLLQPSALTTIRRNIDFTALIFFIIGVLSLVGESIVFYFF